MKKRIRKENKDFIGEKKLEKKMLPSTATIL